ncbi:uncharacterized protein HaLaN_02326, partial [Haematococcus lacustris]
VEFHFPEPSELPPPLIQMIDVDFKYPGRDDFGLQGVNIGMDMGSRVAIVGPNGAGKSIDALCDALEEYQGGVVVISHDAQLLSRLCMDEERSQVLVVEDGRIRQYGGDFEDYRNELIKEITAELDEE